MFLLVFDGVNVSVSGPVSELEADGLSLLKARHVGDDLTFAVLHHGIAAFQHTFWMRCLQGGLEPSEVLVLASHRALHASVEPVMEAVEAFFGSEHAFGRCVTKLVGEQGEVLPPFLYSPNKRCFHPIVHLIEQLQHSVPLRHQAFNRIGRCRGPYVSDQIRNEVVLFVTHRRDDGHRAGQNGSRNRFEIERPEVLG